MREGWKVKAVGEVADHCLGKMLDKNKNRGELKPYLRNLNVRWFGFDLSDMLEMRFEGNEGDRYMAVKGDLLICEGGYPGRAAIWLHEEPVYFQKAIHRVRFREPDLTKWFLYFLYLSDLNGSLKHQFTGAGIQHFTGQALARFRFPVPPLVDRQRLVAELDQAFEKAALLESNYVKQMANVAELKEAVLGAAFAGELTSPPSQAIKEAAE